MSPSEQTRLSGSHPGHKKLSFKHSTTRQRKNTADALHLIRYTPDHWGIVGDVGNHHNTFSNTVGPTTVSPPLAPIGSHRHPSAPSSSSQSLCGSWWLWSTCLHLCLHSQTHQLLRVNLLRVRGPEALKSSVQTDRKQINHYCSRFLSTWGRVQDKSESTWAPSQDIRSETKQSSKSPSQHSKKRR